MSQMGLFFAADDNRLPAGCPARFGMAEAVVSDAIGQPSEQCY
jgi:hypothetical protein